MFGSLGVPELLIILLIVIIIFGANKKEDGTLEAARVYVGRDGITPPM